MLNIEMLPSTALVQLFYGMKVEDAENQRIFDELKTRFFALSDEDVEDYLHAETCGDHSKSFNLFEVLSVYTSQDVYSRNTLKKEKQIREFLEEVKENICKIHAGLLFDCIELLQNTYNISSMNNRDGEDQKSTMTTLSEIAELLKKVRWDSYFMGFLLANIQEDVKEVSSLLNDYFSLTKVEGNPKHVNEERFTPIATINALTQEKQLDLLLDICRRPTIYHVDIHNALDGIDKYNLYKFWREYKINFIPPKFVLVALFEGFSSLASRYKDEEGKTLDVDAFLWFCKNKYLYFEGTTPLGFALIVKNHMPTNSNWGDETITNNLKMVISECLDKIDKIPQEHWIGSTVKVPRYIVNDGEIPNFYSVKDGKLIAESILDNVEIRIYDFFWRVVSLSQKVGYAKTNTLCSGETLPHEYLQKMLEDVTMTEEGMKILLGKNIDVPFEKSFRKGSEMPTKEEQYSFIHFYMLYSKEVMVPTEELILLWIKNKDALSKCFASKKNNYKITELMFYSYIINRFLMHLNSRFTSNMNVYHFLSVLNDKRLLNSDYFEFNDVVRHTLKCNTMDEMVNKIRDQYPDLSPFIRMISNERKLGFLKEYFIEEV